MALELAGVRLEAQGAAAFAGDLAKGEKAVNGFVQSTQGGQKAVGGFGQVAIGMARQVGGAIVNFGIKAGAAVLGFGRDALQTAGDYEESMNVLQEQSGATDAEMEKVRQTARALGADLSLPGTSAADAGTAMLELSKGGLTLAESMAAAKGTLQLAAAAQTDVATAANITTGAIKAFGLEGSKAGYVADLLSNAANQSRASITDLGAGFQQAAFRFRSAGQGADDLAASLAILTNNGLTGSDAGTALQNMLARLQAPTDKAAKLMAELGINVYDAQGNMRPMADIIAIFNDRLGGMTQAERNAALSTILLSDGMKAMIPLMAADSDGFLKMKDAVNVAGAAQGLAAAQMEGFQGAAEGLQSQLETLALEGLEPLLPVMAAGLRSAAEFAGSFSGKVGPAVIAVLGAMSDLSAFLSDNAVPALVALGVATVAYATTQIPILLPAVGKAVAAFGAQALAMGAALLPFALIGVAIFGIVKAYQALEQKVADATTALLESRQWWQDSATALDTYANSSIEVQEKTSAHAATIRELRTEIEAELNALGRRMTAGEVTESQYDAEMAKINAKRAGLIVVTEAMNQEIQALVNQAAASTTATAKTDELAGAQPALQEQIQLTAEQFEALAKEFQEIMTEGGVALSTLAQTHATFVATVEGQQTGHQERMTALIKELESAQTEEKRKGIEERLAKETEAHAESMAKAAAAYAEQAAAQRSALGEQLLAYIENQRQMGNITNEKAAEIRETTITHFGVMRDSAAAMFGEMAMSVDEFASDAGTSAADVRSQWQQTEDKAVELKSAADKLKDKYIMEIVAEMDKPGANIDALRKKLADVPKRVEIELITRHIDVYEKRGDNVAEGGVAGYRAGGGPVRAMSMYMVGERGRELFVPNEDGFVINAADTRRLIQAMHNFQTAGKVRPVAGAAELNGARNTTTNIYNGQMGNCYTMPVYTNNSPAIVQQSFAIAQAASLG